MFEANTWLFRIRPPPRKDGRVVTAFVILRPHEKQLMNERILETKDKRGAFNGFVPKVLYILSCEPELMSQQLLQKEMFRQS